jgi:hypothetical protein
MALVVADRVKETTTTTGTGAITLAGAEVNFVAFSSVLSDGDTTYYAIVDDANQDFEVGLGTYATSGNTLTRTTVLASSNGGSAVDLSAGSKEVFINYPAGKSVYLDGSGQLVIGGTAVTSTAAELNILDGVTATTAEINILDGVTASTAEINILDGVTSTTAELNLLDGSTANTVVNSKAVIYGSGGEVAATSYTGDGSALTGISAGVGALTDGSAVVTSGDTIQPLYPSQAWNYDTIISTSSEDEWVSVDGSITPAVNEDTARHSRGYGGVIWSDYWKRYFATTLPNESGTGSISTDNMRLVQSLDGVNWSDVGSIRTLTGLTNSGNTSIVSDWLVGKRYRPNICVDDSNGRIWCAGEGRTSPYPLVLGYFDPATGAKGTTSGPTPSSANQNCKIIDWRWIKGLNKIIIIYSNRNEYFSTASISAGGSSVSSVQTNINSGNDEMEIGFFHTQTAASTHKFYLQQQSSTFWYREGSDFGSLSSGTSAEGSWSTSHGGDMSNNYLIKAEGNKITYIRTDNDDWKTNSSSWTEVFMPSNTGLDFVSYDPVKGDWIGAGEEGFILRSTNGTTWTIVGRCATWARSKAVIARRTTGAYSY